MEMGTFIWIFIGLSLSFGPWFVSAVIGTFYQKSKKDKLLQRESATRQDPLTNLSKPSTGMNVTNSNLVWVSVVMSPSWFQMMIGGIHSIFGGRINIFLNVIDWARREAKQRLREKILADGWDNVINLRFETSMITKNKDKKAGVEILVYGTAVKY